MTDLNSWPAAACRGFSRPILWCCSCAHWSIAAIFLLDDNDDDAAASTLTIILKQTNSNMTSSTMHSCCTCIEYDLPTSNGCFDPDPISEAPANISKFTKSEHKFLSFKILKSLLLLQFLSTLLLSTTRSSNRCRQRWSSASFSREDAHLCCYI